MSRSKPRRGADPAFSKVSTAIPSDRRPEPRELKAQSGTFVTVTIEGRPTFRFAGPRRAALESARAFLDLELERLGS